MVRSGVTNKNIGNILMHRGEVYSVEAKFGRLLTYYCFTDNEYVVFIGDKWWSCKPKEFSKMLSKLLPEIRQECIESEEEYREVTDWGYNHNWEGKIRPILS